MLPTVVAGLYGVGRGQDRIALVEFIQTLAQSVGPDAISQHVDTSEYIKRLAASSGIDYLNLIKSNEDIAEEQAQQQQQMMASQLMGQAGQLAKSPLAEAALNGNQQGSAQAQEDTNQEGNVSGGEGVQPTP